MYIYFDKTEILLWIVHLSVLCFEHYVILDKQNIMDVLLDKEKWDFYLDSIGCSNFQTGTCF